MTVVPRLASAVSIVVIADLRQIEITPVRLRELHLFSEADVLTVKYNIMIPGEIVGFETEWLSIETRSDRLQITASNDADFERARDVALGILRSASALECSKLGINRSVHLELGDFKSFDAIGPKLANLSEWDKVLLAPALKSMTVLGYRENLYGGRVQVQVEPSVLFPLAVYVTVNDHYDLAMIDQFPRSRQDAFDLQLSVDDAKQNTQKSDVAKTVLSEEWDHSMQRADSIIESVARGGLL